MFPNYFNKLIENKIYLLSDKVLSETLIPKFEADSTKLNSTVLFFNDNDYKYLSKQKLTTNNNKDKVEIVQISPQSMILKLKQKINNYLHFFRRILKVGRHLLMINEYEIILHQETL